MGGAGRPLVAEPWVERAADFSSQWTISRRGAIEEVGVAELINDPRGGYSASRVGKLSGEVEAALPDHRAAALQLLKKIREAGYFGPLGIDAMLYHTEGKLTLHPVVEVNARKTMSLVAICLQRRHFPGENLAISYRPLESNLRPLLPSHLGSHNFKRQLYLLRK